MASPLEPEHVARIEAADPRVSVLYEPDLLPVPRYPCDHNGVPRSLSPADLAPVVAAEQAELTRRVQVYRGGRPLPRVAGWYVIVVDDGLATGVTARAALRSLRAAQAAYVVLAAPVAAPAAAGDMRAEADQVIILATPRRFRSVGEWYRSFGQLTDADVLALLG